MAICVGTLTVLWHSITWQYLSHTEQAAVGQQIDAVGESADLDAAMGVFDRNIGLIAGLVNTCCYLVVSMAMAVMAYLPEESQAPLGWLYIAVGGVFGGLLLATQSPRRPAGQYADRQRV